jgi:uncharacterized protein (DUF1800 family)
MMKRFSSLAALAAVALGAALTGCVAADPNTVADQQLAREDMEYTTGSNLPRKKTGKTSGKMSREDADELVRQLEIQRIDGGK